MSFDEIVMRASAIKLLANIGDKQAVFDECNRIIAICEAAQQSVQRTAGKPCLGCGGLDGYHLIGCVAWQIPPPLKRAVRWLMNMFFVSLKAKWEMREFDSCPPCLSCGHKHRLGGCVCGCENKAWREYPPVPWWVRQIWFWIYDIAFHIRHLTPRAPDLPKAEQIGKVYPGTWEEVDKSNDDSASG